MASVLKAIGDRLTSYRTLFHDRVEQHLVIGRPAEPVPAMAILTCLWRGPLARHKALAFLLALLRARLPQWALRRVQRRWTSTWPLPPQVIHEMRYTGHGWNSVFAATAGSSTNRYAIGVRFLRFRSRRQALAFAREYAADFEQVWRRYGHIPDLVPREWNVVFRDRQGYYRQLIVRDLVEGELIDVFSMDWDALRRPGDDTRRVMRQLDLLFETADREHAAGRRVIDIKGYRNLSLVLGEDGSQRLALVEPHYVEHDGMDPDPVLEALNLERYRSLKSRYLEANRTMPVQSDTEEQTPTQ